MGVIDKMFTAGFPLLAGVRPSPSGPSPFVDLGSSESVFGFSTRSVSVFSGSVFFRASAQNFLVCALSYPSGIGGPRRCPDFR